MNKLRRKQIEEIAEKIVETKMELELLKDEEQESVDNMPENLKNSERYSNMESAIDTLDNALTNLEDAISELGNIE